MSRPPTTTFACPCLNITFEASRCDKITTDYLELSEEEKNHKFFQQGLLRVKLLQTIIVHSFLTKSKVVGDWTITRCINCRVHTHAVHAIKGVGMTVMFFGLLRSESIGDVRGCNIFSNIYNIAVCPIEDLIESNFEEHTYRYLSPPEVKNTYRIAREIANEYITCESHATQERIRMFTDEQLEYLNRSKEKAAKELNALIRAIYIAHETENQSTKPLPASSSASTSGLDLPELPPLGSPWGDGEPPEWMQAKLKKKSPKKRHDSEELIFQMDEMDEDEVSSASVSEPETSDKEDKEEEEGVSIPRAPERSRANMARSLPVSIPTFNTNPRQESPDDVGEVSPTTGNIDIAASIRALARSVHGDPIFGELPRPRFNTDI